MTVLSVSKVFVLFLTSFVVDVNGALLKQTSQIQLSNVSNLLRTVDDDQLVIVFGNSDQDDKCVTAESPVTCDGDAGNYGKRVNAELQPNKDPAADSFEVTVDENDATNVCVKRSDAHENAGWGQDLQIACKKNVCTCTGGTVVDPKQCTATAEMCGACDDGFTLADNACAQNTCTCTGGTPQADAGCTADQAEMCSACDTGFHQDGDKCTTNVCTCDGGTPQADAGCTADKAEMCSACDTGFHQDRDKCTANVCTCNGGNPKTGADCDQDHAEKCASCSSGWQQQGDKCVQPPPAI